MTAQIVYTFADMLIFGLICLFVAFSCGMAAARDARIAKERRERANLNRIGGALLKTSKQVGAQVLRSMTLSGARKIGNEEEGRLRDFNPEAEPPDEQPVAQPSDVSTHSEN